MLKFVLQLVKSILRLHIMFKSLFQLSNTKTTDNRQTLMHFLVGIVEKQFPDIRDFSDELIHVEKAVRGRSTKCWVKLEGLYMVDKI